VSYDDKRYESVYSIKLDAGKRRNYFFDVKKTKSDDFYVTITEATKKINSVGTERHTILLYKEDFNRFLEKMTETINHVKNELMPDYDYDLYAKRQEEWEASQALKEGEDDGISW